MLGLPRLPLRAHRGAAGLVPAPAAAAVAVAAAVAQRARQPGMGLGLQRTATISSLQRAGAARTVRSSWPMARSVPVAVPLLHAPRRGYVPAPVAARPRLPVHEWSAPPPLHPSPPATHLPAWPTSLSATPILLFEARLTNMTRMMTLLLCCIVPFTFALTLPMLLDPGSEEDDSSDMDEEDRMLTPEEEELARWDREDEEAYAAFKASGGKSDPIEFTPVDMRQHKWKLHAANVAVVLIAAAGVCFNRRLVRSIHLYPRERIVAVRTLHTLPHLRWLGGAPRPLYFPLDAVLPPLATTGSAEQMVVRMHVQTAPWVRDPAQLQAQAQAAALGTKGASSTTDREGDVAPMKWGARRVTKADGSTVAAAKGDSWSEVAASLADEAESAPAASPSPASSFFSSTPPSLRPGQTFLLNPLPNGAFQSRGQVVQESLLIDAWSRFCCTGQHSQAELEALARANSTQI